jgi:rod shape-determining protein MreD
MRARRIGVLAALVLTALLLQVSVLPLVAGGAFVPDLVLVLVVVLTLEHGPRTGLWVAAVGGLLVDLAGMTAPLGSGMLVLVTLAYVLGLLRPYLAERADLTTAILTGIAAVVAVVGQATLATLLSEQGAPGAAAVAWSSIVLGAFAVLLAPLVLIVVRRVVVQPDELPAERLR